MSALQFFWFFLIGLLFSGFFFLEGFDFGVGMAVQTLAHNEHEKDQVVETIGPVWDGNEVWLLTGGGAMFASFPYWYASLFSGYYLILLMILFGLIIRGVSFEFRHKVSAEKKQLWNWTLTIGSAIVPFFFGIMFISLIQGMPLDASGNLSAQFSDYFNIFSLVGGVAMVLLAYLHGLNYIALKTEGPIRERARNYAQLLYWVLYLGLALFAILLYFKTDFFSNHPIVTTIMVLLIVVLAVLAHASTFKGAEMTAFLASGFSLVSVVVLLFQGLFPRVMISSISPKYDLLIQNASSTPYTLKVMSIVAITLVPFVLAYTAWAYYIFRKRITLPVIVTGEKIMLDKAVMRLSGIHKLLGLLAGLDVLQAIFIIGQAYYLSLSITGLWEGQKLSSQTVYIILFMLSYLGRHIIDYIKNKKLDDFSTVQSSLLRRQLLDKLFDLGPKVVQEQGTGNVVTMALDGISLVENYLRLVLNKMINMSIIPWIILAYIFYLDIESGAILFIVFPLIIIFMIILGYAAQAKADKQYESYQVLSNHFLDSLRGIDTLKYFGLSKRYGKSIYQTSESFRKATMSTLKIGILSTFALDFFTTLSIAIVAVFLGLRLLNEQIYLLPALTILILSPEYFLPVRDFSSDYHATLDGKNAFQAIQKVLNKTGIKGEQLAIHDWSKESNLDLENIAIAYDQKRVVEDVTLRFRGHQKIALVGVSGSGKSSLINLLSGFLGPDNGSLKVDGREVTNLDQEDWHKQMIYIPQTPYVFEMSLRDNITFYTPNASDEEVIRAIHMVGLDSLLSELPDGLETRIGNGARPLSGGQAQRIALARAFLDQNRRIMVFDEPTAHLDIETELELKEKMLPLMSDRLVIFATHRLHWLNQMDVIVVMEKGRVAEVGSYQELLAKKGYLYQLKHAMGGNNV